MYSSAGSKQSFCSISDDLRHGPSAIWAHLHPVLMTAKGANAHTVHFLSDGPTTQYRSKNNFYLFSARIHAIYGFQHATWNFSESGHGKGAADGIGAVVKRSADRLIAQGCDIPTAKILFDELNKLDLNVQLYYVNRGDIELVNDTLPLVIKGVEGTMKLHQIVSHSNSPNTIRLKQLSCFCSFPGDCNCYEPKKASHTFSSPVEQQEGPGEDEPQEQSIPRATTTNDSNSIPDGNACQEFEADNEYIGRWCAVVYDREVYPGIIQNIDSESVEVKCMAKVGRNRYFWPMIDDIIWYDWKDVLGIVPPLRKVTQRHMEFTPEAWMAVNQKLNN